MLIAISGNAYQMQTMMDSMTSRYGYEGANVLNAWIEMIERNRDADIDTKLEEVNTFFNRRIRYKLDIQAWKKADYWASPLETMGIQAGDCEDFTIAKYMTLLELGLPEESLRLIYVKATLPRGGSSHVEAHMVLGYYPTPGAIPIILDSLIPEIKIANERLDLNPVYSFNRDGLWVGNIPGSQADPTARLSPWRDVLQRMQEEGF